MKRREENLGRLCGELGGTASARAAQLAGGMYLAHSTSVLNFADVSADDCLKSAAGLGRVRPGSAEEILGTAGDIFFYVAPFRYPSTNCGLLFAAEMESDPETKGVATPFDSGGLLGVFARRDSAEAPRAFLSRHELPLPDHRQYLALQMTMLFEKPEDYIEGREPKHPGPVGLTEGDARRWTHEVRIADRVHLTHRLKAVFASEYSLRSDRRLERLFTAAEFRHVDQIIFEPEDSADRIDFTALRSACLDYFKEKLY